MEQELDANATPAGVNEAATSGEQLVMRAEVVDIIEGVSEGVGGAPR